MNMPTTTAAVTTTEATIRTTAAMPMQSSVPVLRMPIRPATRGGQVEHLPDRPHVVDVARMLARVVRRAEELAAPAVMDLPAAAGEDVRDRKLAPFVRLRVVVAVERRARRRVERCESPAALLAPRGELLDRRLRDDRDVDAVEQVTQRPVHPVEDRRARRARDLEREALLA